MVDRCCGTQASRQLEFGRKRASSSDFTVKKIGKLIGWVFCIVLGRIVAKRNLIDMQAPKLEAVI